MPLAEGDKVSICHPVCASVMAAMIGGASMGSDASHGAMESDSHANMAVAGSNCTIVATSGCYASITPFSSNLPTMDMVEIGDAAIAYDDPILHVTYLLVMQNALLIPTMNHNLIPPFLIREAGLYVDKTPKHQVANPTVDNHVIVDPETGMRIHLSLNGIFPSFPTHALTHKEIEDWEKYPIVFITPDSVTWDPYASHYAENEAAMLDSNGLTVDHDTWPPQVLFTEANLCKLYGEPVMWDEFNNAINQVCASEDEFLGCPLTNDEVSKLRTKNVCCCNI
jgi:hypothetical protein